MTTKMGINSMCPKCGEVHVAFPDTWERDEVKLVCRRCMTAWMIDKHGTQVPTPEIALLEKSQNETVKHFIGQIASPAEWLTIMRCCLPELIKNQTLLAELIFLRCKKDSKEDQSIVSHYIVICEELGLYLERKQISLYTPAFSEGEKQ